MLNPHSMASIRTALLFLGFVASVGAVPATVSVLLRQGVVDHITCDTGGHCDRLACTYKWFHPDPNTQVPDATQETLNVTGILNVTDILIVKGILNVTADDGAYFCQVSDDGGSTYSNVSAAWYPPTNITKAPTTPKSATPGGTPKMPETRELQNARRTNTLSTSSTASTPPPPEAASASTSTPMTMPEVTNNSSLLEEASDLDPDSGEWGGMTSRLLYALLASLGAAGVLGASVLVYRAGCCSQKDHRRISV